MLSKKQLEDICLKYHNNYKTCRYCAEDDQDSSKFYCAKMTAQKAIIDSEVEDYLKKLKKKNQDLKKQGLPVGDNCTGYPFMKHIEQGYDKDNK
jgi:hypothetical protein